jgi:spore coat polysaccharide biosynthesis protein SpsF
VIIGAIIQARTTSTRLPRKVLKELPYGSGITVLEHVIRRLKRTKSLKKIIVATTENKEDDDIVEIAKKEKVAYFRGSENDVLSRYYHAARKNSIDIIVRITSDCPCIDPQIVDSIIEEHIQSNTDYSSNTLKRTFPHGLDVEVFNFNILEQTYHEACEDFEKEHVTPFIYRSGNFNIHNIEAPSENNRPGIRVTLDTKEDYIALCAVYDFLYSANPFFGIEGIVGLFNARPWIGMINEKVVQKKIFNSLEEELREAEKVLALQDLLRARDYVRSWLEVRQ